MQIRKSICDRCGNEIPDDYNRKDYSAKINYWHVGASRCQGGQQIDLCVKCADEFVRFLEGENYADNN